MAPKLSRRSFLTTTLASTVVLSTAKGQPLEDPSVNGIALPQGLTVFPPQHLDVTYQILPFYSETESVLAIWQGDALHYFITLTTIPNHWKAAHYFARLQRDLSAGSDGGRVTTGRQNAYGAQGRLKGHTLELSYKARDAQTPVYQVAHFLSDGNTTVVGFATTPVKAQAEIMYQTSTELFKTARVTHQAQQPHTDEHPYVGTWVTESHPQDGLTVKVVWTLKADLTFATQMSVNDVIQWSATGVWHIKDKTLVSEYLYSDPPMPNRIKTDEDEILTLEGNTLTLRSKRTKNVTRYMRP